MKHHKYPLSRLFHHALAGLTLTSAPAAIAGTTAYRDVILADNPIVYYELDETSGTTAANSATTGATYEGTFNTAGGSVTVGQASFAQGGTAYDFGGGFIGAASALVNSLDEWTVEAWVNYDSAKTSASNFLSNDQGGWNNDVLIGIGAESGHVGVGSGEFGAVQQGNPGTTRDAAGAALAAGEWHHVAVTGSTVAGTMTVYIDGVAVASDTNLVNGVTFNGADGFGAAPNLTIGAARPDSGDAGYRPYDGLLDEVAVYDSALDATTLLAHYNVGTDSSVANISITSFASVGVDLWELTLEGAADTRYELRSSTTLEFNPGTLVENLTQGDPGDPGSIGGTNNSVVTTDGDGDATVRMTLADPANFVRAQIPPPLFSEDFDAAAALPAGWTSNGPSNGTDWEVGVPSGVASGPTTASSAPNCAGTNIGGYYTENADVSLISPSFLVPVGSGASLSFRQFTDTDFVGALGDLGSVRILDADNSDTPIAGLEITGIEGDGTGGWANGAPLTMTAGEVGGKNIKVEFRFVSNAGSVQDTDVWSGFYVDDVLVTEVAP